MSNPDPVHDHLWKLCGYRSCTQMDAFPAWLATVYGYGNFAIELDPKFFHKRHIQSVSENLKLWAPISNPNPKLPTQLHMGQNIW